MDTYLNGGHFWIDPLPFIEENDTCWIDACSRAISAEQLLEGRLGLDLEMHVSTVLEREN